MEADDGWRVGGGKPGGAEGERANARSVTPHCAHLPTRPTPKFELGSQPHRFSSTRLPSSSPPPLVLAHSPIDPLHDKRTERDISLLLVRARSVCGPFSFLLLFFSLLYSRREQSAEESIEACCPPVVFLRESISMSSTTCLSRSLSLDNRHHVLVVVLVRHAAKRLDFAHVPYPSLSRGIGAKARPYRPSGFSSRYYFAGYCNVFHQYLHASFNY